MRFGRFHETLLRVRMWNSCAADALANLTAPSECAISPGDSRGLALARIERGFLLVDCGDFDRAALDAEVSFRIGLQDQRPIRRWLTRASSTAG